MALDMSRLVQNVRMKLGGLEPTKLPTSVITYWADHYEAQPEYTGKFPWVYYKTTLACIDYLKINSITSGSANASKTTRKVGDVSETIETSSSSGTSGLDVWDKLYDQLANDQASFGIVPDVSSGDSGGGLVLIGGTNKKRVDAHRENKKLSKYLDNGNLVREIGRVNGYTRFRRGI
ncbi:hypothetical protein [Pseudoalteromonas phage J2-1_QLiu-2017]|nr:hypothetical protein [Pseudoalteromonas phage J2-1_QLiu-2017]